MVFQGVGRGEDFNRETKNLLLHQKVWSLLDGRVGEDYIEISPQKKTCLGGREAPTVTIIVLALLTIYNYRVILNRGYIFEWLQFNTE